MNFTKKESFLFYCCLFLNTAPIVSNQFFPTMDGPAHLYNASILHHLCAGDVSVLNASFKTNAFWIPNWTGHILLSVLLQIFPAWAAEKALLLLYAIGMPIAFRQLVLNIKPTAYLGTWLILPFVYNYLFCLGFYNLALSLIAFFIALTYWHDYLQVPSTKKFWATFIGVAITYWSHPFTFTLLVVSMFLQMFIASEYSFKRFFYFVRAYLWVVIIPVVLLCQFYLNQSFPADQQHLQSINLWKQIADVRSLICYHHEKEQELTQFLFGLYLLLTGTVLYQKSRSISSVQHIKASFLQSSKMIWLIMSVITLFLLFVVPDNVSAGMMSDRLMLFFFIFWTLWLALQDYPKWLRQLSLVIVLIVNFGLVFRYMQVVKNQHKMVDSCRQAAAYITPNSTILPLNYHSNWLAPHFSNYLGIEKPMLILENYEANTGWFPLKWRNDRPSIVIPDAKNTACWPFVHNPSAHSSLPVDYIFVLGNISANDPCAAEIKSVIDQHYTLMYHSETNEVRLYHSNY